MEPQPQRGLAGWPGFRRIGRFAKMDTALAVILVSQWCDAYLSWQHPRSIVIATVAVVIGWLHS